MKCIICNQEMEVRYIGRHGEPARINKCCDKCNTRILEEALKDPPSFIKWYEGLIEKRQKLLDKLESRQNNREQ